MKDCSHSDLPLRKEGKSMKFAFVFMVLTLSLLLCSCEEPDLAQARRGWIAERISKGSVVYLKDSRTQPPLCFAILAEDDAFRPSAISPLTVVPCGTVGQIATEIGKQ